jgi:excinuclease ABC subunit C
MIIPYKEEVFKRDDITMIPNQPGIYKMVDKNGIVMYIGKSKSLRSRVRSYFNKNHESEKLNRMVMFVDHVIVFKTETHLDAMLLEIELIKENRPLYNSQFKKSDQYSYLDFNSKDVFTVSGKKPKGKSLGPFRNSEYLMQFKSFVAKISPLSKMLEFSIIPRRLSEEELQTSKDFIFKTLTNESDLEVFKESIILLMNESAARLEFETAASIKHILTVIDYLSRTTLANNDVIYYDELIEGIKAYKISEYTIIGYGYFDDVQSISEFEEVKYQMSEKDILDHQLVVYHELRKNPNRTLK